MLLQCGMDGGAPREQALLAAACLRADTLATVVEINELALTLLGEQAAGAGSQGAPLLREVGALWRRLDAAARRRAAACPYLLLDGGFADRERWRSPSAAQVADPAHAAGAPFFTVPGTVEAARLLFICAWHLARAESAAARLLLGMPPGCAAAIGACTLRQIHTLAEQHPEWLRPRWLAHPALWRELLCAADSGETHALERARLHGLTMLAAEARLGHGSAAGGAAPALRAQRARETRSPGDRRM